MELVTAAQMREIDRLTIEGGHVSGPELMSRAGKGIFEIIRRRFGGRLEGRRVLVVCGKGNNGGDGFVIARHLIEQGAKVSVYVLAGDLNLASDAKTALHQLIPLHPDLQKFADRGVLENFRVALAEAELLVDALFGTGLAAPLREPAGTLVRQINASGVRVLSVDVPSGLSGDLCGEEFDCEGAVRAELTATIGLPKIGLYHYPGRALAGEVEVVDIGFPQAVIEGLGIGARLVDRHSLADMAPAFDPGSHKYRRGSLLIMAGSRQYGGAALLTAGGALRGGVGMVYVALPESLVPVLQSRWPSAIAIGLPEDPSGELAPTAIHGLRAAAAGCQALALGPGLGRGEGLQTLIRELLAEVELPTVLDADALYAYRGDYESLAAQPGPRVLTPHSGELGAMLGLDSKVVDMDREQVLSEAHREGIVLLHKGAPSMICCPDGLVYTVASGHPAMARGGTGDILTGLLGALLAQRPEDPGGMSRFGAWLHAEAGRQAALTKGRGLCSEDIIEAIPGAWRVIGGDGAGADPAQWLPVGERRRS